MVVLKIAQKVNIHLGYFIKKICHQELSKIAQSGHTDQGLSGFYTYLSPSHFQTILAKEGIARGDYDT